MFCFSRNWTNPYRELDSKKQTEGGLSYDRKTLKIFA